MERKCENCRYFRGHYIKWGKGYSETRSGHCVYPRLKLRYKATDACKHWKEK